MKSLIVLIALMTAILLTVSCTKITTEPKQDKEYSSIELSNKQTPGWIIGSGSDILPPVITEVIDSNKVTIECVPPPPGHGLNGNQGDVKPPKPNTNIITSRPNLVAPHINGFSDISGWHEPPIQPPIIVIPNSLNDGVNKEIPKKP